MQANFSGWEGFLHEFPQTCLKRFCLHVFSWPFFGWPSKEIIFVCFSANAGEPFFQDLIWGALSLPAPQPLPSQMQCAVGCVHVHWVILQPISKLLLPNLVEISKIQGGGYNDKQFNLTAVRRQHLWVTSVIEWLNKRHFQITQSRKISHFTERTNWQQQPYMPCTAILP